MLGDKIKSIRLSLGMSMTEFGRAIDDYSATGKVKSGTVNNWESGKNAPNNERIKKIASLGGSTVDELVGSDIDQQIENMTLKELKRIARVYLEGK